MTAAQDVPPPPPGFKSGLEGHVAFHTEIAEPDKDGGALRYRGVDIEDLAGKVSFGNVWGLLVEASSAPACRPPNPSRFRCTPGTSGWTSRRHWRCSRRSGDTGRSWISVTRRHANSSPARR